MTQTEIVSALFAGIATAAVAILFTASQMRSTTIELCATKGQLVYGTTTITCQVEKDTK